MQAKAANVWMDNWNVFFVCFFFTFKRHDYSKKQAETVDGVVMQLAVGQLDSCVLFFMQK